MGTDLSTFNAGYSQHACVFCYIINWLTQLTQSLKHERLLFAANHQFSRLQLTALTHPILTTMTESDNLKICLGWLFFLQQKYFDDDINS